MKTIKFTLGLLYLTSIGFLLASCSKDEVLCETIDEIEITENSNGVATVYTLTLSDGTIVTKGILLGEIYTVGDTYCEL